jgi:hypothetical protein
MAGVQFDETQGIAAKEKKPAFSLTGFLITIGIVKDAKSAEYVLLLLIMLMAAASFFFFDSAQKTMEIVPAPPPAGFSE